MFNKSIDWNKKKNTQHALKTDCHHIQINGSNRLCFMPLLDVSGCVCVCVSSKTRFPKNDFHILGIIIIQSLETNDKSYHLSTKLAVIKSNSRRLLRPTPSSLLWNSFGCRTFPIHSRQNTLIFLAFHSWAPAFQQQHHVNQAAKAIEWSRKVRIGMDDTPCARQRGTTEQTPQINTNNKIHRF